MEHKRFTRRDFLMTPAALTAMTALGEMSFDLLAATDATEISGGAMDGDGKYDAMRPSVKKMQRSS